MNGELTDDCLPDVLRRIYTQRVSGILNLKRGAERRSVFFENGSIVFASSNSKEDRLGESMVRYGVLTSEDFHRASAAAQPGKRFGRVLVELGMCDDRDLEMNVEFQILDIIYSLFEWETGSYEFIPQEACVPDDLRLDLSTASMILEGVRRIQDFSIIERGLGDVNCLIGPSTNPLLRLQSHTLKPLERQILEALTQPTAIFEVIMTAPVEPQVISRALYGLLSAGLLERFGQGKLNRKTGKIQIPQQLYAKAAQAPPLAPPTPAPASPPVPTAPPVAMPTAPGISPEAEARLTEMREKMAKTYDPCEILGVTWSSNQDEVREAYFALAKDFHPDRFQGASREIRQEVEQIFTRLASSFEILRASAPPATPTAPLRVTRPQGTTQPLPSQAPVWPPAQRPITQPLPPQPSVAQSAPRPITQPLPSSPMAAPTVVNRPPVSFEPIPSSAPTFPQETAAQREQRAESMYLDARNRYISRDFIGAAHLMREVVRLNSTQGRYFLLLGNALATQPKTYKEAESFLRRAKELDPFNVLCYSSLGQLYVRAGMPRQAESEFREALKLDPDHQTSLRELDKLKAQGGGDENFLKNLLTKPIF
ncbi:MAG: DUF4388 domain-containing protein [Blastocatellia bacterium]|nr:DUF4388 domain-containing protein [Blastocatellia bacterium]